MNYNEFMELINGRTCNTVFEIVQEHYNDDKTTNSKTSYIKKYGASVIAGAYKEVLEKHACKLSFLISAIVEDIDNNCLIRNRIFESACDTLNVNYRLENYWLREKLIQRQEELNRIETMF